MDFPQPLTRGRLLRRYKRFLADVALEGGIEVTAHVANPGAMLGLSAPGAVCWLSPAASETRKLRWSVELVEAENGAAVVVNTAVANRLADEAVRAGAVPELAGYASVRREAPYGEANRIDLLLEHPARRPCWVEVKSVTLSRTPRLAEWPDCVSARSTRQLAVLETLARRGERVVLWFLAQRADCERFGVAADLDPAFARALAGAREAGIEVLCHDAQVDASGVRLRRPLAISASG